MENVNELPEHVKYWLMNTKHDCFFKIGPPSGTQERIGAFKVFLMGHSEPLRKILGESEIADQGDISLPDTEPNSFITFLCCVYGGIDVIVKNLIFDESLKLLYIAEKYLVAQIKDVVLGHLMEMMPLSIDNFFIAINHPVCLQIEILSDAIEQVIECQTEQIFAHQNFLNITSEQLMWIVKQESLSTREIDLFKAVLKWGEYKVNSERKFSLREYISSHLQFIRFRVFTCEEFCLEVVPKGLLTVGEIGAMCPAIIEGRPHQLEFFSEDINLRNHHLQLESCKLPVLSFAVEDVTHLVDGHGIYSKRSYLGGFSWQLSVFKRETSFGIFLDCEPLPAEEGSMSWECKATAELILLNQSGKPSVHKHSTHTFCEEMWYWGFKHFIDWDILTDPSRGFIQNDNVVVVACLSFD